MKRLLVPLLAAATVVGLPARPSQQVVTGPVTLDAVFTERARQAAAAGYAVEPERLDVVYAAAAVYPGDRYGVTVKLQDPQSGATYPVTLDATGRRLDVDEVLAEGRILAEASSGRLETSLAAALALAPDDQLVPVVLWLAEPRHPMAWPRARTPAGAPGTRATEKERRAFLTARADERARELDALVLPVVDRLRRRGYLAGASRQAPAVSARLRPPMVREVARWAEVDRVFLDVPNEPEANVARATTRVNVVHRRGIRGAGVKIAQVEVNGRVATDNPYLGGVVQDVTEVFPGQPYVCASPSAHSTVVAGLMASTNSPIKGFAFRAALWATGSCSGFTSELQNRSLAALAWGARALNLSWGSTSTLRPGVNDRFYDDLVLNQRVAVVKSAGNNGAPCREDALEGYVTSPGLGYNVITVGAFDDRNTNRWSDDIQYDCSSWRNPTSLHGDRQKPEVVAPGVEIVATSTSSPWIGSIATGTSFSAAMVTGAVALLLQRAPDLGLWPEAVKAIIMATAVNNIEGGSRLSEYDGAGAIVADRADDVARRADNGNWGGLEYECGPGEPVGVLDLTTMPLQQGRRTRAVVVWGNDTAYADYEDQPGADLDLVVLDPNGVVVKSSLSLDNTFEIVDFKPRTSGVHTLRVSRTRCDMSPRYLGWAWWRAP